MHPAGGKVKTLQQDTHRLVRYEPIAYLTKSLSSNTLPFPKLGCQSGSRLRYESLSPNIRPRNTSATIRPPTGPSCGVVMFLFSVTGIFVFVLFSNASARM